MNKLLLWWARCRAANLDTAPLDAELVLVGGLASPLPVNPDELPVVFLGSLDDARLGGAPRAEGGHEGAVLAAKHQDVGV